MFLMYIYKHDLYIYMGLVIRVFASGAGDRGSILGRHTRLKKMLLDTSLLHTQHYKEHIQGKVEQSWEWSSVLSYTSV